MHNIKIENEQLKERLSRIDAEYDNRLFIFKNKLQLMLFDNSNEVSALHRDAFDELLNTNDKVEINRIFSNYEKKRVSIQTKFIHGLKDA